MSNNKSVREEFDDNGDLVTYKCEVVDKNKFTEAVIPFYYDLVHPCGAESDGVYHVSSTLLEIAALRYRIKPNESNEADGCAMPPQMFEDAESAWVMAVSSLPEDGFETSFDCQSLTPNVTQNECCTVVKGEMTFTPVGDYNEDEFKRFVADRIDAGAVTDSTSFQVKYLGSEIEYIPEEGRGNLTPPIVNPAEPAVDSGQRSFTVYGGIVLAGLAVAFIGVVLVVLRRRRRYLRDRQVEEAVQKSGDIENMGSHDSGDGPTLEVDVMSDEMVDRNASTITDSFDGRDDSDNRGSYTFDLGDAWRDQVVGAYGYDQYGPTTIAVVPPYPMEETSDSEVDSWAQTDGTVGSLEDRLEEITAEI